MSGYKNIEKLTLPKMIIFDYGHTLIYEQGFDGMKGTQAVMAHAIKNPRNLSVSEVNEFSRKLYRDLIGFSKEHEIEIHNLKYQNLVYEYLEIELALTPKETEKIYWDNAAPGIIMPYIDEVITYINERGIRSGVISNISFSGDTLAERINRLIPHNKFEFIIASSEYVYRKPNRLLFELALIKAGLKPQEVWFCGDNIKADIIGASKVGIFPVWYESSLECFYLSKADNTAPDCDHLHITDWRELIQMLKQLEA
ncbi:MAG TPA: HAD family hydrolase [Mobilitalea sp.]|nr:HAD family hydrolase [Mobilitalea sp.]